MTIIESLKTYLADYSELKDDAPLWVDFLGPKPTQYTIIALAGPIIVNTYIDGSSEREYPFAFRSVESTADELERLETLGFYEEFAAWLESQTAAGEFPALAEGQTPTKIKALGRGYLYQEGESNTGIYQVQGRLEYTQEAN